MRDREYFEAQARDARRKTIDDDVRDLIPAPEPAAVVWARFRHEPLPEGDEDLTPAPEPAAVIWDRFNLKARKG